MNHSNINITVTGGDEKAKEIVSNVVTNALVSEGFSNVALVSVVGEPIVGTDIPSAMDVMRQVNPEFLATQIRVIGIPTPESEDLPSAPDDDGIIAKGAIMDREEDGTATTMILLQHREPVAA